VIISKIDLKLSYKRLTYRNIFPGRA